jgi:TolB-like protein
MTGSKTLLRELRRRRVFKTVALYVVGAWVALQVTELALPALEIPDSAIRWVWIAVFALFPLVLLFGWRYDVTRGGIRHTPPAGVDEPIPLTRADHWIIGGFSMAGLVVVAAMLWQIRLVEPAPTLVAAENSIAVLPFEVCEAHARDQPLAHQLATQVLNRLAERRSFKVYARTTAFTLAGTGWTRPQIAGELNVRYLLAGELCRDGDDLTITAELSDGEGFIVQRKQYVQVVNPYGQIEQRLATQVANDVAAELGDFASQAPDRPVNRLALEQLMLGMEFMRHRAWEEAGEAFDQALELEPDYPEALFQRAILEWGHGHGQRWVDRALGAREIADRALEVAERQVEQGVATFDTYYALGKLHHTQAHLEEGLLHRQGASLDAAEIAARRARIREHFDQAERHFRTAAVLNPSETEVYTWLADTLDHIGGQRRVEALEILEQGLERDPLNWEYNGPVAFRLAERGYYRQAMERLDRLKALPDGYEWYIPLEIMNNHGRYDEKMATLVEILQTDVEALGRPVHMAQLWWTINELYEIGLDEEGETLYQLAERIPFTIGGWWWADWAYENFFVDLHLVVTGRLDELIAKELAELEGKSNDEILDGWYVRAMQAATTLWVAGERERSIELTESLRHVQMNEVWAERQTAGNLDLARMYTEVGRQDDAMPLLQEALEHLEEEVASGVRHPETLGRLADTYALLGRDDEALDALELAVDYGYWFLLNPYYSNFYEFSAMPFDHLADDPRFIAQMDRMAAIRDQQAANVRALLERNDMEALLAPVIAIYEEKAAEKQQAEAQAQEG